MDRGVGKDPGRGTTGLIRPLVLTTLISAVALAVIVLTQEPAGASVVLAIGAASLTVAAVASLVLLRLAPVGRSARARWSRLRALRRGVEIGAIVGLIALLRVIDGLTPLTALFVVLSFAVAEYVLSSGATASR